MPVNAVIASSERKAVVLIHGLSESRAAWSRQQSFLQRSMNVLCYDVRGFGASPVGAGNGTVQQMADDLAQILSSHDMAPAWLIGFSMGGVIAQRFALDFPAMVQGLILVASSCTVGRSGQAFFRQRIEQVTHNGLEAISSITQADARGCFSMGDEQLIAEYQQLRTAAVRDPGGYLNACRAMLRLADEPMIQELGAIKCPTLVLAGELDPYCPPRASEMISKAIPGSELAVVPGAGHCVHWEARDITNERILEFIERQH
jgi:pimeloyl-ACP methyl ester carboxylesterase